MSATNFWNNFTHGFIHGVFNNNPFFGCGFNNWNPLCGINNMPFNHCFTSLFLVPSVMNGSFYPMMQETMPPAFNIFSINQKASDIFPDELWKFQTSPNSANDTNLSFFANPSFGDSFISSSSFEVQPSYANVTRTSSNIQTSLKGENNQYDSLIQKYATKYGVEARLVKALMKRESGFNPNAKSGAGAIGLMQLMPATAKAMGVTNIYDPEQNIEGGVKYLKKMLDRYNGNKELAIAAYNAGPGNVKNGKIPQNGETPKHVREVMKNYNEMA